MGSDTTEAQAQRAAAFGSVAAEYDAHRPDYPAVAIDWALQPVRPERIVDLAAGTGKLTAGLGGTGADLLAVEWDHAMLRVLTERVPGVPAVCGSAERLPVRAASVDAVVVGQAFHWFDAERALTEIARVLRPGGVLAALWNYTDARVGWVAEFEAVAYPNPGPSRRHRDKRLPAHPAFGAEQSASFQHAHRRSADSLISTVATQSALLVLPAPERSALLNAARDCLQRHPETAHGEFDLPMMTSVSRLIRR